MDNVKNGVKVTLMKHAVQRIVERIGVPKKAAKRQFLLALERGYVPSSDNGDLLQWVVTMKNTHSDFQREAIIFNNHLFLYASEQGLKTLITVLKVPNTFKEGM